MWSGHLFAAFPAQMRVQLVDALVAEGLCVLLNVAIGVLTLYKDLLERSPTARVLFGNLNKLLRFDCLRYALLLFGLFTFRYSVWMTRLVCSPRLLKWELAAQHCRS